MANIDVHAEWFVLKQETKYGPFSYIDIVKMLQEKSIFEYDYVWHNQMSEWEKIINMEEFKEDKIKALSTTGLVKDTDVFYRRRYARAQFESSIVVHNNKQLWKAESVEIGAGGASLVMEADKLQVGHILFLHFKADHEVPPFNAICTVVSCRKHEHDKNKYCYGVRFTSINGSIKQAINNFASKKAA